MRKRIFIILAIIPLFLNVNWFTDSHSVFSANTGLYFFSALLQANAAILSIVGVFYIFKVQSIQNTIHFIKSSLLTDRFRDIVPAHLVQLSKLNIDERRIKIAERGYSDATKSQLFDWTNLDEKVLAIKDSIKLPSLLLVLGIAIFAIGLLSAHLVHSAGLFIEFRFLYLCFLYELVCLYFVLDAILKAIR